MPVRGLHRLDPVKQAELLCHTVFIDERIGALHPRAADVAADGTGHKNRMQGNDFVQALMYRRGVTCANCHDVHGTDNPAVLVAKASEVCFQCHEAAGPVGPRAATIEAHTHHRAGPGNECVNCHMPKIEQTLGDVNVRSHTFTFVTPAVSERSKIPNACILCHADKTNAWATAALRTWTSDSPWRVAQ